MNLRCCEGFLEVFLVWNVRECAGLDSVGMREILLDSVNFRFCGILRESARFCKF